MKNREKSFVKGVDQTLLLSLDNLHFYFYIISNTTR